MAFMAGPQAELNRQGFPGGVSKAGDSGISAQAGKVSLPTPAAAASPLGGSAPAPSSPARTPRTIPGPARTTPRHQSKTPLSCTPPGRAGLLGRERGAGGRRGRLLRQTAAAGVAARE